MTTSETKKISTGETTTNDGEEVSGSDLKTSEEIEAERKLDLMLQMEQLEKELCH